MYILWLLYWLLIILFYREVPCYTEQCSDALITLYNISGSKPAPVWHILAAADRQIPAWGSALIPIHSISRNNEVGLVVIISTANL